MAVKIESLNNLTHVLTAEDRAKGRMKSAQTRKRNKELAAAVMDFLDNEDHRTKIIKRLYDIAMNADKDSDSLAAIDKLFMLSGDHPDINLKKLDLEIKKMRAEEEW